MRRQFWRECARRAPSTLLLLLGACGGSGNQNAADSTAVGAALQAPAGAAVGDSSIRAQADTLAMTTTGNRTSASSKVPGGAPTPAESAAADGSGATGPAARGPVASAGTPAPNAIAPAPSPSPISKRADTASITTHPATAATPTPLPPPATVTPAIDPVTAALARLPFRVGERLEYQVKYGFLGVGNAALEVIGVENVRGSPAVHASFSVNGGVKVYRVNDKYESWFDPFTLNVLRAVHDIDEGSYERERKFEIYPERKAYVENDKPEQTTVADPLDEGSFIYFLRTLPLEVGKTYEFNRYFRPDRNPVRVVVLRKERVKVPAGQFDAIVVRPIIKTTGIFGEGGKAELWFTDDSTRTLVQMKSQLKFGSLNLFLKNVRRSAP
jgi:hypothetical protein